MNRGKFDSKTFGGSAVYICASVVEYSDGEVILLVGYIIRMNGEKNDLLSFMVITCDDGVDDTFTLTNTLGRCILVNIFRRKVVSMIDIFLRVIYISDAVIR